MNENMRKFRNAVGGYHKDDVNRYIQEADRKAQEQLAEKEDAIAHLTSERDEMQCEIDRLHTARTDAEEKLAQALADAKGAEERRNAEKQAYENAIAQEKANFENALAAEKTASATAIASEQAHLAEKQLQFENAIAAEKEKYEQALADEKAKFEQTLADEKAKHEQALADEKAEFEQTLSQMQAQHEQEIERLKVSFVEDESSAGYKIQMYDRISSQIGDILLGANRDADELLAKAREEAERIRTETNAGLEKDRAECQAEMTKLRQETRAVASDTQKRLSDTATSLLSDISGEMRVNMESCLKELTTCITEVEYDTATLLQTFEKRYQDMNDRIQYFQSCMQEHIEARLAELMDTEETDD